MSAVTAGVGQYTSNVLCMLCVVLVSVAIASQWNMLQVKLHIIILMEI